MTNLVLTGGLKAVSRYSDAGFNGSLRSVHARSDYAVSLYMGDPVIQVATGSNLAATGVMGGTYVGGAGVGQPIGTLPDVNIATAGATNRFMGAVHDFGYNPQNTDIRYAPASTDRVLLVTYDPAVEYEIVSDGAAALHTYADIGANANLVAGAGETVFGNSGWKLDSSTVTTDATYQLTILAVSSDSTRNDMTAANPSFIVKNNLHSYFKTDLLGI